MCLVLAANARDVGRTAEFGLTSAQVDRLRLTPQRVHAAATGLREIAALPDPVGRVLDGSVRPNGLRVERVGVPIGVILFIYESRPNVTVDAAGLAVKSATRSSCAAARKRLQSNVALQRHSRGELEGCGLPADAVQP